MGFPIFPRKGPRETAGRSRTWLHRAKRLFRAPQAAAQRSLKKRLRLSRLNRGARRGGQERRQRYRRRRALFQKFRANIKRIAAPVWPRPTSQASSRRFFRPARVHRTTGKRQKDFFIYRHRLEPCSLFPGARAGGFDAGDPIRLTLEDKMADIAGFPNFEIEFNKEGAATTRPRSSRCSTFSLKAP